MYVDKLEIKNFKCFEETAFELNYPGRETKSGSALPTRLPNVNLFLGGNGTGKSSVFKALALAILAPVMQSSGFAAEYLVRRQNEIEKVYSQNASAVDNVANLVVASAQLQINMKLESTDYIPALEHSYKRLASVYIQRMGEIESVTYQPFTWLNSLFTNSPTFFLIGYGANRRSERPEGYSENSRTPRYRRVAGLFEDHVGLPPFTYAYLQIQDKGWLGEALTIINSLLPEGLNLTEHMDEQNRALFEWDGILLPLHALSDGYRTFVAWVWDLLFQLAMVFPKTENSKITDFPGVVIVDEIDLFLHPEWQRLVVQQVADAFPNIQFLFSSHSPLVAGTLEAAHIYMLDDGKVEQYKEEIYGLPPNQVLTSSYFGLSSTRAPGTGTLTDLAKLRLGIDDPDMFSEQSNPSDPAPPPIDVVRNLFKNSAANSVADKPKVNATKQKDTPGRGAQIKS